MDTRKIATEYRLVKWAQIIKTRQSRGQSIKEFCTEMNICKQTYFYWQRKLRETACMELSEQNAKLRDIPSGWMNLEPRESKPTGSLTIEVQGCLINVNVTTNTDLLLKVCRALKTL